MLHTAIDATAAMTILCPMPRTILVVDDDPHIRELLIFALNKAALATEEAVAALEWPGARPEALPDPADLRPEPPRIDLNATSVLPARPSPIRTAGAEPAAAQAGQRLAPILARTRQVTLASPLLLDAQGRIALGPLAGGSYAILGEVRAALAGQPATVIRRNGAYRQVYAFEWLSRAAAIRIHHARPIIVGGKVVGVTLLSRSARALFVVCTKIAARSCSASPGF